MIYSCDSLMFLLSLEMRIANVEMLKPNKTPTMFVMFSRFIAIGLSLMFRNTKMEAISTLAMKCFQYRCA